jgi:hypothetical protein
VIGLLDHWQTLVGAVIGGLMGFVGAYVVASSAATRERRSAARQLTISIGLWENVYKRIEKFRTAQHKQSDGALIAEHLAIYRAELPPLFEQQVLQVSHLGGGQLAGFPTAFLTVYRRMESYAAAIAASRSVPTAQPRTTIDDESILALDFARLHSLAGPATYLLLPECELSRWRRWTMKRDRALCPTEEDLAMQALIQRQGAP